MGQPTQPKLAGNTPATATAESTEGQDASAFNPNFRAVIAHRVKVEDEKNPKITAHSAELKGEPSEEYKRAQKLAHGDKAAKDDESDHAKAHKAKPAAKKAPHKAAKTANKSKK
jgi:hypothetical protein